MPVDAYGIDRFSDGPADCGSDLPRGLSFEQWLEIGSTLKGAQHSLMWRLGDWLAYGEKRPWGAKYDKAVEDTGISNGILRNAKWIAKRFPLSRRRDKLTFAHHQEVASLPPEEAEALLDEAEAKKLSRNDLRVRVAGVKAAAAAKARLRVSHDVLVDSSGRPLVDQIICGDARAILRSLPDAIIDVCVTSPPYFGLRDYNVPGQIGLEETIGSYVAKIVEIFREIRRVLRHDGTAWLNIGDSYASYRNGEVTPDTVRGDDMGTFVAEGTALGSTFAGTSIKHKDLIGIPWRLARALQDDGWYLRSDIIWHKPNPMPESVADRPTTAHEHMFLLAKSETYFYASEAIKTPVKQDWGTRDRTDGKYHKDGTGLGPHSGLTKSYLMANRRSVWTIPTRPYPGAHFATFPPELVEIPILAGSPENGLVLDPFMGSGTTAVTAKRLKRHYIGIELNPEYVAMAEQRIADEKD